MLFFEAFINKIRPVNYLFLLLLSPTWLTAQQETKFEIVNQRNGLTSNSVSCILQDSTGFLWIGTGDGLNKYNGVSITPIRFSRTNNVISSISNSYDNFIWVGTIGGGLISYNTLLNEADTYIHEPANATSLSDNNISFTHQDRHGYVWVATDNGGLDKLDPAKKQFKKYRSYPKDAFSLSSNQISYLIEDKKGNIWIGTHDAGLNFYHAEKDLFVPIDLHFEEQKAKTVYAIYEDDRSVIWVGTDIGLFSANLNSDTTAAEFIVKLPHQKITSVWEDDNQSLWVSAGESLFQKGQDEQFRIRQELKGNYVLPPLIGISALTPGENDLNQYSNTTRSVVVDKNNRFWMLTANGLDRYDPATEQYDEIRKENDFNNLNSNSITSIYEDASGTIWLGTLGGGLNKYRESNFKTYTHKPGINTSLTDGRVVSFMQDDDDIWVTTFNGGFNRFDKKRGVFERHQIPGTSSIVFDMLPYRGRYFLATYGDGMVEYNYNTDNYTFYRNSTESMSSINEDRVQRFFIDRQDNFWVGTAAGLNLFDPKSETFQRINLNQDSSRGVQNVFAINEFDDKLYLGTLGQGLYIYDPKSGRTEHFQNVAYDSTSISNDLITSIHFDKEDSNVVWIGTYGGGLGKFDRNGGIFKHYSKEHGLPNDVVYGILEDHANNLWFSTNAGLSVFNKRLDRVINTYDIEDGLQANEFNRGAYLQLEDGPMLFGGVNGINLFDAKGIRQSGFQAPLVLTDFKIFNETRKDILTADNAAEKQVCLNYDQNFISIEFAVLDFRNVNRISYAYRLKGLEDYWNYVTNDRPFANYTNIDPGEYTFELKATNSEGIWLDEMYTLQVLITPPFWRTWWFRILALIAMVALIWTIYRIKVRNLKRQKHRLNLEVMKRTRIIQEQNEEIATQNEELSHQNEEIMALNESLEEKVVERTKKLEESHQKLIKHALFNSHSVRAPLARLLGLTHLFKLSKEEDLKTYVDMIEESAKELDEQIKEAEKNLSGQFQLKDRQG